MQLLLIADRDEETRRRIAGYFSGSEYSVIEANSVDVVRRNVLKREARVILLGSEFDGLSAMEMIPLLKKCNQNLTIILISNEESLPLIRRLRQEGIFYHALKPVNGDDRKEIRQVVYCAFHNSTDRRMSKKGPAGELQSGDEPEVGRKGKGGLKMKTTIATIFLLLAAISPAFAAETVVVYKSGILVLVFVGVCALIVVAQLVPALILFTGFIKALVTGHGKEEVPATESTTNGA